MSTGYDRADADTLDHRRRLALAVRDELAAAGLPVCAEHRDPRFRTGASVTIDAGADAGGGVWVAWEASPFLRQLASDAVRDGRTDDVALWHHGRVMAAMEQSIVAVLRSAGYTVEPDANDMEPFSVLVQGLAEGPLWRDGLDRAATSGPKQ